MKTAKIYIDLGSGDVVDFGKKLKRRLLTMKGDFEISIYTDFLDKNSNLKDKNETWETKTIKAIDSADIVIPVLSAEYLTYLTEDIQQKFDAIFESKDKFLFPMLYSPSDWSNINWIVKSKMTPDENTSISEIVQNEQDRIINAFIKTIESVVLKINSSTIQSKQLASKDIHNFIFISHDHDDGDFAELVKLKLEKEGLKVWLDNEKLKIGQDWREEIDLGIENSLAVIVIMTPEARKSEYVTYEWAFAWGKQRKIFPLMLKQTHLHPRLESLQYLDFTNRINRPWIELIAELKKIS